MNSNDSESAKIDLTSRIVDMWQIFGIEIRNQTDRGMAIVTAAFLEDELANTIKAHFVVNDDDTDALFASQSSLGSFDAKSRLAYAMGLIGLRVFKDLDCIRRIRNRFAHWTLAEDSKHKKASLTFDTQSIADLCSNLVYPDLHPQIDWAAFWERIAKKPPPEDDDLQRLQPFKESKKRFLYTVAGLQWALLIASNPANQADFERYLPFDYGSISFDLPNPTFLGFKE